MLNRCAGNSKSAKKNSKQMRTYDEAINFDRGMTAASPDPYWDTILNRINAAQNSKRSIPDDVVPRAKKRVNCSILTEMDRFKDQVRGYRPNRYQRSSANQSRLAPNESTYQQLSSDVACNFSSHRGCFHEALMPHTRVTAVSTRDKATITDPVVILEIKTEMQNSQVVPTTKACDLLADMNGYNAEAFGGGHSHSNALLQKKSRKLNSGGCDNPNTGIQAMLDEFESDKNIPTTYDEVAEQGSHTPTSLRNFSFWRLNLGEKQLLFDDFFTASSNVTVEPKNKKGTKKAVLTPQEVPEIKEEESSFIASNSAKPGKTTNYTLFDCLYGQFHSTTGQTTAQTVSYTNEEELSGQQNQKQQENYHYTFHVCTTRAQSAEERLKRDEIDVQHSNTVAEAVLPDNGNTNNRAASRPYVTALLDTFQTSSGGLPHSILSGTHNATAALPTAEAPTFQGLPLNNTEIAFSVTGKYVQKINKKKVNYVDYDQVRKLKDSFQHGYMTEAEARKVQDRIGISDFTKPIEDLLEELDSIREQNKTRKEHDISRKSCRGRTEDYMEDHALIFRPPINPNGRYMSPTGLPVLPRQPKAISPVSNKLRKKLGMATTENNVKLKSKQTTDQKTPAKEESSKLAPPKSTHARAGLLPKYSKTDAISIAKARLQMFN